MKSSWKQRRIAAVAFGVVASILILAGLEVLFYLLNKKGFQFASSGPFDHPADYRAQTVHKKQYSVSTSFRSLPELKDIDEANIPTEPPPLDYSEKMIPASSWSLEGGMVPNVRAQSRLRRADTGEILYEAVYTTDDYGRRITTGLEHGPRNKHLILLGCSLVFGEGINDDQTLSSQIAKITPRYRVYNSGESAASAVRFVERIQRGDLWNGISESEGVAVYVLFKGHLERFVGPMSIVGSWGPLLPFATEDDSGRFVVKGNFLTERPISTFFYRLIWPSQIRKFFSINIPWRYDRTDYQRFAKMVLQVKNDYLKRFPDQKFYVVFHPIETSEAFVENLSEEFEALGIEYLDYGVFKLQKYTSKPAYLQWDGHPTAEANRILAPVLVKDLRLNDS